MVKLKNQEIIAEFEKGPIRRSLYSNGAVSLFHHAKGYSGAVVQLHFIAGSIFEKPEEAGMAHLIEHLFFKENEGSLVKQLELGGAAVNAYTYKENVCFEMSCNAKKLPVLLKLFLQKFFELNFTDEELSKEKEIVIQEIREDLDDHETQAIETLFAKNFAFDFGHQVGGQVSKIKKFSRKQIEDYFHKFFTPERMLLVVVSGKKNSHLENDFLTAMNHAYPAKAKKSFRLKAHKKSLPINHFKSKYNRKMENALIAFSFNGPSLNANDYYNYVVLDDLLFEGLNSVFFKKLRVETPLIYGLGSSLNSFSRCGNFLMIFNTHKKNTKKVEDSCEEVFQNLKSEYVSTSDLEFIKQRIIDSWELSFDDLEERAEFIAGSEIYKLTEYSTEHIKNKIMKVTPQSLRKTFNTIYDNGFSKLVYQPV